MLQIRPYAETVPIAPNARRNARDSTVSEEK